MLRRYWKRFVMAWMLGTAVWLCIALAGVIWTVYADYDRLAALSGAAYGEIALATAGDLVRWPLIVLLIGAALFAVAYLIFVLPGRLSPSRARAPEAEEEKKTDGACHV